MADESPDRKLVQKHFEFTIDGIDYVIRIPSVGENIRLGIRAKAIRAMYDPASMGMLPGLDNDTVLLTYGCAVLETLLEKCSDDWPVTKDAAGKPAVDFTTGKPKIDHTTFPSERTQDVLEVGARFYDAMDRFRARRTADRSAASTEAVGAGQNPGA